MNNNNNRPFKDFHGDIDSFLEHCSGIDANEINDDTLLDHEELVDTIAEDYRVSKEEAHRIAMGIKLDIVRDTTRKLCEEGFLILDGYDEDGECIYMFTEKGRQKYGDNNRPQS